MDDSTNRSFGRHSPEWLQMCKNKSHPRKLKLDYHLRENKCLLRFFGQLARRRSRQINRQFRHFWFTMDRIEVQI